MSHIREGLGYTLKSYDPCFDYNADRFCCSDRGAQFRENVVKQSHENTKQYNYSVPRTPDQRPLSVQQSGIFDPVPYTFTAQDHWHVWCGRMPCTVDPISRNHQLIAPCQKNQPRCSNPATCSK